MTLLKSLIADGSIDDEAALVAFYDWRTWWARENQLPPLKSDRGGDWRVWLLLAGRGFGKTRTGVQWLIEQAADERGPPLAIIGRTAADVRDVLVEGPAGILKCSPPWNRPLYEPSKRRLTWKNGRYATTFSAEEPDQLRGPQFGAALADEIAAWSKFQETWDNLLLGLRLGDHPRVAAMTTPRPLQMLRDLLDDRDVATTRGRTLDNVANLSRASVEYLLRRFQGTRQGKQELDGILLSDLPGALWTEEMVERASRNFKAWESPATVDRFDEIVVALDPSGSEGEEIDEGDPQGITVQGRLKGKRQFVILEDLTGQRRPEQWARMTIAAAERWKASAIVAEKNYGGAMVRATIHAAGDPPCPVRMVTATRGKAQRAEPVSALYEQGLVAHAHGIEPTRIDDDPTPPAGVRARGLVDLEEEQRQFTSTGYKGKRSPNRADAAIWGVTWLAYGGGAEPRIRAL